MKLKYLGTAAAEGMPALFCTCPNCQAARRLGGRNIRTRSQALVDDTLLIDFPPDTFLHQLYGGLRTDLIRSCIVTHAHSDHLYAADLEMRKEHFAELEDENAPFTIYAAQAGYDKMVQAVEACRIQHERVRPVLIHPGQPFEVEGYRVLPLWAAHAPKTTPVVFVVEKGGKRFGYFHDTSILPEKTWQALQNLPRPLNLVSLDCTEGAAEADAIGHMNLRQCETVRDRLLAIGAATKDTIFVLNHFSHNGGTTVYDDFRPIGEKNGFVVSYDGMELQF